MRLEALQLTVEYNRRRGLSTTVLFFGAKLISSTNDQFANVAPLLVILCYRAFIFIEMETYKWHTIEPHSNNEETMNDYLENHLSDEFEVIFEDGTYAEIKNKETGVIWGVNASGDGDFTHHKVEFEFVH